MTSSNAYSWNKKYFWITWVMKFGQFLLHYKIENFIKKLYRKRGLESFSRPFFVYVELSNSMENDFFEISWFYWICNSKNIKLSQNQRADFLRFLTTKDPLKIKELELVSWPYVLQNFSYFQKYYFLDSKKKKKSKDILGIT